MNDKIQPTANIRQTAEERLKKSLPKTALNLSKLDTLKLIHELQVHQIELEMQSEELMLAKSTAEAVAEKYTQLYDFAPSGYFTLSRDGKIIELNLSGAKMLGKDRQSLKTKHFDIYVSDDTKPIFNNFIEKVFSVKSKESCEVTLSANGDLSVFVYLDANINENAEQCLLTATDITERKEREKEREKERLKAEELEKANTELIRFNKLAAERELRMIQVKQQVNDLSSKLGMPPPYPLAFIDASAEKLLNTTPTK
ncbi:MAG: PAS domain-containing protein [Lentisphaerota bacterium]